ncbi:MAG: phosphatase PAP2 family protein [Thermodesulfovibrionales bacterium]
MHFLKENKGLIFLALLIVPAFYFDKTVMTWIIEHRAFQDEALYQPIDNLVKFSTHGATLIILSLLVFLGTKPYRMRLSNAAKVLFIGLVTAGIAVQGLKHVIGRARPRVMFDAVFIGPSLSFDYDSFPSGHTSLVFCLAFILSRIYPRYTVPLYLYAVLAAADRMVGLSHFPSDVIAGVILGTVVGTLVLQQNTVRTKHTAGVPGD